MRRKKSALWKRLLAILGWNQTSYLLLSAFVATLIVIGVVWWPLLEMELARYDPAIPWWRQTDWLLIGNFLAMSLLIMAHPDLKQDIPIALIALGGGLAIEGWGTQTEIWHYYTAERPPLWIIPAWPIARLSVERLVRFLQRRVPRWERRTFIALYWITFPLFYALMLAFVWPYVDKSLTMLALIACGLMILKPTNHRLAVLTFLAGAGLGYFLERWGTSRYCWVYYTEQTSPPFAVLAHGMAAVAFWRTELLLKQLYRKLTSIRNSSHSGLSQRITDQKTRVEAMCASQAESNHSQRVAEIHKSRGDLPDSSRTATTAANAHSAQGHNTGEIETQPLTPARRT